MKQNYENEPQLRILINGLIDKIDEHGTRSELVRNYIFAHSDDHPDFPDLALSVIFLKKADYHKEEHEVIVKTPNGTISRGCLQDKINTLDQVINKYGAKSEQSKQYIFNNRTCEGDQFERLALTLVFLKNGGKQK